MELSIDIGMEGDFNGIKYSHLLFNIFFWGSFGSNSCKYNIIKYGRFKMYEKELNSTFEV